MNSNVYGLGRKKEKLYTSDMIANIRKSQTTKKFKKKEKEKLLKLLNNYRKVAEYRINK